MELVDIFNADPAAIPADSLPLQAVLCATKTA